MTTFSPTREGRPVALPQRRRQRDLTPVLIALAWASVGALSLSLMTPAAPIACPIVSMKP